MSHDIDPIVIDRHGVTVGGHQLRGATRWTCRQDYERNLHEVTITLCTSRFRVDLDPSCPGMITAVGSKGPEAQPIARCASFADGIVGASVLETAGGAA